MLPALFLKIHDKAKLQYCLNFLFIACYFKKDLAFFSETLNSAYLPGEGKNLAHLCQTE
jgi:hypothetical protein